MFQLPVNASADFLSTEDVCEPPTQNIPLCICRFFPLDDNIPENNETFPVSLVLEPPDLPHNTVNTLHITVMYNDDPFGLIGFQQVCVLWCALVYSLTGPLKRLHIGNLIK